MNLDEMKEWLSGGYAKSPTPPPISDDITELGLVCHLLRYPQFHDNEDKTKIVSEYGIFITVWKNYFANHLQVELARITAPKPTNLISRITKFGPLSKFGTGGGQALAEIVARKIEAGHTYKEALEMIQVVHENETLVLNIRDRLLCRKMIPVSNLEELEKIVVKNIVCHDPFTYDNSFNGTNFTNSELEEANKLTPEQLEAKIKYNLPW